MAHFTPAFMLPCPNVVHDILQVDFAPNCSDGVWSKSVHGQVTSQIGCWHLMPSFPEVQWGKWLWEGFIPSLRDLESFDHLFLECPLSSQVWDRVFDMYQACTFSLRCSWTNTNVCNSVATDEVLDDTTSCDTNCSIPVVHLKSDSPETERLNLLGCTYVDTTLTCLPVLSEEEQNVIVATPAHPSGLYDRWGIIIWHFLI